VEDVLSLREQELLLLGRICLSVVLGAAIGFERELAAKSAGLRTHMLVAGGATLFMGLGDFMVDHFVVPAHAGFLRLDPVELLAALVSGIAFLGAGAIIRQRDGDGVSGLTTAASLLFTGIVGAAVALGRYVLAVGAAILLLVTLRLVLALEKRLL
jgi:putative Mg2+ transporter-C (MgtC) family protein